MPALPVQLTVTVGLFSGGIPKESCGAADKVSGWAWDGGAGDGWFFSLGMSCLRGPASKTPIFETATGPCCSCADYRFTGPAMQLQLFWKMRPLWTGSSSAGARWR